MARSSTLQATVVYARSTTSVATSSGRIVRLAQGQPWASSDPVVRQHPDAFTESPMVWTSDRGFIPLEDA